VIGVEKKFSFVPSALFWDEKLTTTGATLLEFATDIIFINNQDFLYCLNIKMIRSKYNYEDDEPLIGKKRKTREKPIKEVKQEQEVYKILRETREARNKPSSKAELDEESEDEEIEKVVNTPPLVKPIKPIIEPVMKPVVSAFHPVQLKYDDKFINSLKNENDDLKRHITDLRQFHAYNDRLNSVHHIAHRMKIKLSNF